MTITEFLLARIAEDEAVALAANGPSVHAARHDPTRVLAECAAKRAIIEQAERSDSGWWESIYVAILAAVYADHPDYDPSWA